MNIETLKVFLAKKKLERDKMQAHKGRATSLSNHTTSDSSSLLDSLKSSAADVRSTGESSQTKPDSKSEKKVGKALNGC